MTNYYKAEKEITKAIGNMRKSVSDMIPIINKDIESIIKKQDKSEKHIEKILNLLLNTIESGYGDKEFWKLNKYYSTFNEKNSYAYEIFYSQRIKQKYY